MSDLSTAEFQRLTLIAAGVDPSQIPPILDTATWRRMLIAAINSGAGGIPDAPEDGDLYGRKNGGWEEAASPTDIPIVPSFVYDGTAETTFFVVGDIPSSYAEYNTDITQLYLGNGVTSIGSNAFNSCYNLTGALTIPNSVTSIGSNAFNYCYNLTGALTIPNSVTSIGNSAFYGNSLTSLTIGNSVTSIGNDAFYGNFLTSVTIPNSVTSIGNDAFYGNSLTSLTIGNSVTSIGNYAFGYNNSLATVNCYVAFSVIDAATDIFLSTASPLTINVPTSGAVADTWTVGTGLTIGGNNNVTVVKNL